MPIPPSSADDRKETVPVLDAGTLPKISADSHVLEPRYLFLENLPAAMRERAPKTIRPADDGGWELVGHREHTPEEQRLRERAEEGARLGALQPGPRLEVMKEDGIRGECVFPTIGLYLWGVEDAEVGEACCQIYNDWIYDQLESKSPRFRCAGLIPTWTVELAVKELRRIASLGLGAAMLPLVGTPEYNHPSWEPLWEELEAGDLPAVMHQGTGHDMVFYRGPGASVANLMASQSMAPRTAALLAMSGVLERHPGLHFVFVEVNASWIGWTMDTLDFYTDAFSNYLDGTGRNWVRPKLAEKPSLYIGHQIHATFQDDPSAVTNLARTGVTPLLWGSDFPHEESTYPHSRETVSRLFSGMAERDVRKIVGETAAGLFHFDPSVLTTPV